MASWNEAGSVDHIVLKRGYRWYGTARVWQEGTLETWVSLLWDPEYEEPWLLISDKGAGYRQVQLYAWRMRVEATFQDSKSRGWNIEASWIVDRTHLDRLLLGAVPRQVVGLTFGSCLYS